MSASDAEGGAPMIERMTCPSCGTVSTLGRIRMIGPLKRKGGATLVGIIAGLVQVGAFGEYGWTILWRRAPVVQRASLEQR